MIDLNTATAGELNGVELLRGHGFEIVRYREERRLFTSLRQLDEVPGLAQKRMASKRTFTSKLPTPARRCLYQSGARNHGSLTLGEMPRYGPLGCTVGLYGVLGAGARTGFGSVFGMIAVPT
ncbi:ComEA family DNA-binding protein [Brevundimonas vesicularis]|uniref:ComEA family DNA-binding protein n=1 Tax=Brevundimonas vesicularis TaxID=41276 RepID=UPI0028A8211A|nr:helix-hairpin-helix domain-containing protein [Brevundimonas vesicularis]